jgi:hypothetical protein
MEWQFSCSRRGAMARAVPLLAILLLAGACDQTEAPAAPSNPGSTQPIAVESFTGTLPVTGSKFYSFTVPASGNVSLLLHTLTENGAASTAQVTIGLGFPRATDCTLTDLINASPGGSAQLTVPVTPAIYCARISDPGNLTATATFGINIIRPR